MQIGPLPPDQLVVISANLWGTNGPHGGWSAREKMIANALQRCIKGNNFFIAFQEATITQEPNTILRLAQLLGLPEEYAHMAPGKGIGYLTNGEIGEVNIFDLPEDRNHPLYFNSPRAVMITKIAFGPHVVTTACTHLTVNPQAQLCQAFRITRELPKPTKDEQQPVIIAGDLNADPSSYPYYYLTADSGFEDALVDIQKTYTHTWPVSVRWLERLMSAEPKRNKWFRRSLARWVDHILTKGVNVQSSFVTGNRHYRGIYPSDHMIVGAVIKFVSQ